MGTITKSTIEFLESKNDFKKFGINKTFELNIDTSTIRRKKAPVDSDFSFIIKGYASTTATDRDDEIITHEAILGAKDDLLKSGSSTVLFNHNPNMPIGRTLSTEVDSKGLIVTVGISKSKDCRDIRRKIKEGILKSFSIGGRFKKVQVERDQDGRITAFKILKMELYEVSVVSVPANPEADIFAVVEKMFKVDKEKTMSKKDEQEKVDKPTEKAADTVADKKDTPPVTPSVTKEDVAKMINDAVGPIATSIKELTDKLTAKAEKPAEKPEEKKDDKSAEIPQWAKDLNDKIDKLAVVPQRKGVVEEETDEAEESETEEKVEKALVSAEDEKSVKFAKYVMNNEDEYNKLTDEEKKQAKSIYYTLYHLKVTKKEN